MKKSILMLSVVAGLSGMSGSAMAGGGTCPMCATEITQILNNVELIMSNITQYETLAEQIKHTLTMHNLPWDKAREKLGQLRGVVNGAKALGYQLSNVEAKFSKEFKGYKPKTNFNQKYIDLVDTTMNSLENSLKSAGYQADDFDSESSALDILNSAGESAEGMLQAQQTGIAISGMLVGQMQKMRQLAMAQNQAHNAFMAHQVQKEADDTNASEKLATIVDKRNQSAKYGLSVVGGGGVKGPNLNFLVPKNNNK